MIHSTGKQSHVQYQIMHQSIDTDALKQNFEATLFEIQNLYFSMFANNAMLVYAISYTWKSM